MPKITLNPFDRDSIDRAIEQVKAYRDSLPKKVETLRKRVAEELVDLAENGFNGAWYDDVLGEGMSLPKVDVYFKDDGDACIVFAKGDSVIWQEFGAGVYYNGPVGSSPHPWGAQNLFLIGEYGSGYGKKQIWGYYDPEYIRDEAHLKLTRGTPASMPMYHATQEVLGKIVEIAREVFKDGDAT